MTLGDGIRRNIATVTKEERDRLRDAIIALHKNHKYPGARGDSPVGGVSFWFKQDEIHAHTHVHGVPAFVPWHRELINRFEALIREIDPELSLHYWDWTQDPRAAPDGQGGVVNLFDSGFMGNGDANVDGGNAGDPWLSAGLYDPAASPFRSDNEFDPNNNPFDPPKDIIRSVGSGAPVTQAEDIATIQTATFSQFHDSIVNSHNVAHGFIGGTIGNAHTSFRDPFVFLLHSNLDRIWAMWQRQPGHSERLDPNQVYSGKWVMPDNTQVDFDKTKGSGDVQSGDPFWGILSPLEPWAGPAAQNANTGIISNVQATRPWAPPENEQNLPQNQKDSKHPTVVTPPSYDTAPHSSLIVTDRDTFSSYEVESTPNYPRAFYVIYDGFAPNELGSPITAPTIGLTFDSVGGAAVSGMSTSLRQIDYEDPASAPDLPQRITFTFDLHFSDSSAFNTFTETRDVHLRATHGSEITDATLRLIKQPNPYMVDGPVSWLSTDVRVFQMRPNMVRGGVTQGDPNADANAPYTFIQSLLNTFNSTPSDEFHPFNDISTDQQASQLELSRTVNGTRVLNYAVAKVRYRANMVTASHVKVFFRMFSTMVSSLDYNIGTNYRRANSGDTAIPLLGMIGGEIASIPFFAQARIDSANQDMSAQQDDNNRHDINAIPGQESDWYFGCWLDFNQTDPQFPLNPTSDGHFSSRLPIMQLVRGHHQCLVAEIYFQPSGTDPIPAGATPASSDRLAQRNLAIAESDNPGNAATHTVEHTFMVKPSLVPEIGVGVIASRIDTRRFGLDELMIEWNNLPRNTKATLYFPEWNIDEILRLANLRQGPKVLTKVDDHTLQIKIADATYIPVPGGRTKDFAGLLSLELPQNIENGQIFAVTVRQNSGFYRKVLGAFQLTIPVRIGEGLLRNEVRKLAVLKYIMQAIPASDRWHLIFVRYIDQVAAKVAGLGADPGSVKPSPDDPGLGGEHLPCPVKCYTGKIQEIGYNCYGEFTGFMLETCSSKHWFECCEKGIETVVRSACLDRATLIVCIDSSQKDRISKLVRLCC